MGAIELEIDRHADELGRLERIEQRVEREWDRVKDNLIHDLARGEALKVGKRTLLDFNDVVDRLWEEQNDPARAASLQCSLDPERGGKQMQQLLEQMAEDLVNQYADDFKRDMENDDEF